MDISLLPSPSKSYGVLIVVLMIFIKLLPVADWPSGLVIVIFLAPAAAPTVEIFNIT